MARKPAKQSTPKTGSKKPARKPTTAKSTTPKGKRQASTASAKPRTASAKSATRTASAPRASAHNIPIEFSYEGARDNRTSVLQWPANWPMPEEGLVLNLDGDEAAVGKITVRFDKVQSGRNGQRVYTGATLRMDLKAMSDSSDAEYEDEDDEDDNYISDSATL